MPSTKTVKLAIADKQSDIVTQKAQAHSEAIRAAEDTLYNDLTALASTTGKQAMRVQTRIAEDATNLLHKACGVNQ